MDRELGVWTYDDCALVLIDYRKEMFEVIRSETEASLVELNVRLLARTRQGARHADCAVDRRSRVRLQRADTSFDSGRARRHRADRPNLDERFRGRRVP